MKNKNLALLLFGIALILFGCYLAVMAEVAGGMTEFIYAVSLIAPFAGILFCIVGLAQSFQKPSEMTDKNADEKEVPKQEEQTAVGTEQVSAENKAGDKADDLNLSEK